MSPNVKYAHCININDQKFNQILVAIAVVTPLRCTKFYNLEHKGAESEALNDTRNMVYTYATWATPIQPFLLIRAF